ncbi:hypothetical protein SAMN05444365_101654 [Micromonospora pattaloongensis]|uniref:Uncharacterized protein n=1 Tax=Micromonospora pattaloongensis TaxID=405436 RepID=A0A1H3H377_9ACTN|nr:hypothetical protein [Micromonospora pattaloongensis]SDY09685.1 hypothetical protein SAMN05444365_101654 [Micromonospora pattaloongensis]
MRGPQWSWLPWVRRRAKQAVRRAVLAAAQRQQRAEYERAVRRIGGTPR